MSCVGFFTPQQLARVRAAAADPRPVSSFTAPEASESKRRRVVDMADSSDPVVRSAAAASYLASGELLARLAADIDVGVRCAVAKNPHATPEVLTTLAGDDHTGVRGWVASNPGVPAAVLEALSADDDATVRSVAEWAGRW